MGGKQHRSKRTTALLVVAVLGLGVGAAACVPAPKPPPEPKHLCQLMFLPPEPGVYRVRVMYPGPNATVKLYANGRQVGATTTPPNGDVADFEFPDVWGVRPMFRIEVVTSTSSWGCVIGTPTCAAGLGNEWFLPGATASLWLDSNQPSSTVNVTLTVGGSSTSYGPFTTDASGLLRTSVVLPTTLGNGTLTATMASASCTDTFEIGTV